LARTPASLARVQQIGIDAYLDEQLAMPETALLTPSNNSMGDLRQWTLHNVTTAAPINCVSASPTRSVRSS